MPRTRIPFQPEPFVNVMKNMVSISGTGENKHFLFRQDNCKCIILYICYNHIVPNNVTGKTFTIIILIEKYSSTCSRAINTGEKIN